MKEVRKILFAANDIGWRIELYSKFLKKNFKEKIEVSSFVNYFLPETHYKTDYTYKEDYFKMGNFERWKSSIYYFFKFLFSTDVYHFLSGETILTRNTRKLEFAIYKLFGKRIIMHFVGSDIRNVEILHWRDQNQIRSLQGEQHNIEPKKWQKKLIKDSMKYADSVLVSTPDLLLIYPGKAKFFPVLLDFEKFKNEIEHIQCPVCDSGQIVILHAPSNPAVKGTTHILNALAKISKKHGDRVKIISTVESDYSSAVYTASRYDIFEYLLMADIVVDQMLIGWYGLQAIEAIMTNNVVLSYIDDELLEYVFDDTPIINANSQNLEQTLNQIIESEFLKDYDFQKAKDWAKKYHSIENNYEHLVSAWGI